jgi:hypothetical protein
MANEKHYVPYGLRDIWFGEYSYSDGTISYANQQVLGRGITATFDLKFAEGRLYSSGALSRYKKKLTGGSISLNVEDLPQSIQKSIFAATEYSRNVGSAAVKSIGYNRNSGGRYVGIATYVPADEASGDGYIGVFVHKAMFGPPSMSYQTENDSIQWTTPTTTGEFVDPDGTQSDGSPWSQIEIAEFATEAAALEWCKACLGVTK